MPTATSKAKLPTVDLRHLVDHIPGIVTVHDVRSGSYLFVNKNIEKILGYEPSAFLNDGTKFAESLVHPDDIAELRKKSREALAAADKSTDPAVKQEPLISYEYRIRHADGRWVWVHMEANIHSRTPSGKVDQVLTIYVDITERKEIEQELRKLSEELQTGIEQHAERLHLALEASKMGTWEWNMETDKLIWSPEMMQLYGLNPEKDIISYEKFMAALHPDDRPMKQEVLTQAVKTGEPYQVEHRCIWPDGSMHWILGQGQAYMKNGKPYRMVGTAMNVDERKATEAALRDSQIAYKTLYDSNVIGIFTTDKDGKIIEANDTFLKLIGYTKSDLKRGTVRRSTITPPEYKEIDHSKVQEIASIGEAAPWEKEYIHKNGSRIPVLLGSVAIPNTDNLSITIVIDVTERQHLAALNKAKDEFISLASHQLRTPATAVKQYIGILMEQYYGELSDRQMFTLQSAYESNERQLTIIDDLLKVARLDAGNLQLSREHTDLAALLNNVIREQQIRFKARKQTVVLNSDKKSVYACVDKGRIYMVLGNILDNAGKYTPQEKRISIHLKEHPDTVHVEIEDQGVGIKKKDFGKLFQKFSRIDNPLSTLVGGSGLGLYWSKRVIDMHGGSIDVKSKVGSGTTFIIKIPTAHSARCSKPAVRKSSVRS